MDAKEFWKEFGRMCTSNLCSDCPAQDLYCSNTTAFNNNDTRIVDAVEKWSKEHPRKTRQSVFLEQYPNAILDSRGILCLCPENLHGRTVCPKWSNDCNIICYDCRQEFWTQESE